MDRPPPEVTIVDPNGPDVPGDVLVAGSERGPWSRRQLAIAGAALAVLAIVAGASAWVRHLRHEQALDRAAIADVHLFVDISDNSNDPPGAVLLSIRNDSGRTVRLKKAQLSLPDYGPVPLNTKLYGGQVTDVAIPDTAPCSLGLLHDPLGTTMRLQVVTARGDQVTRDVPVSPVAVNVVTGSARQRCGYLLPGDAFAADVMDSHQEGKTTVLELGVGNSSLLPLRLLALNPVPGLALTFSERLPYAIPAASTPFNVSLRSTELRLRVTSCTDFIAGLGGDQRGPDSGILVTARVANAGGTDEVPLLFGEPSGVLGRADFPPAIQQLFACQP